MLVCPSVALLFILEIDDVLYAHALSSNLRDQLEQGHVELTDADKGDLNRLRHLYLFVSPVVIGLYIFCVYPGKRSLFFPLAAGLVLFQILVVALAHYRGRGLGMFDRLKAYLRTLARLLFASLVVGFCVWLLRLQRKYN